MKILVLLKEVPVVSEIRIDRQSLTIDRSGVGKMMNPADRHAIEAALALADAKGGEVTAMTMGQESSESILRDAASLSGPPRSMPGVFFPAKYSHRADEICFSAAVFTVIHQEDEEAALPLR